MTATRSSLTVLALALTAAIGGGCGSDSDGDQASGGKQGGAITIAQGSQPDALDPALAYTSNSWEPLWLVYTPPLTYRRAEGVEGAELIPGAAEALPDVSADGKTYSFTIRKGLKYSDGTPVKASDFEHAIKRVLNLESGGSYLFEGIDGATEYVEAGEAGGDIAGIEANDRTGEVTVRLTAPDGSFNNALATTFAGLVPASTPFENQTQSPPPGVGPYAITESTPNRQFVMEKVEGFDIPGIPQGNLDTITTKIVKSSSRQAQDVIDGELDYMQDAPPTDLTAEIKARYSDRYKEWPTLSTNYFFLNQSLPPFDDEQVREAVNVALDSTAIARLFGGRLAPTCNLIPPGIPGQAELDPCPFGDPNGPGDIRRAKQLVEQAGATGDQVTVYANNDTNRPQIGEYYTALLNDIGLDAELRVIDGAVYFNTIGKESTKAQTGLASWYADFPHPASFMQQLDGTTIQPTNNTNFGYVDDPVINRGVAELSQEPDAIEVADRWAELERRAIERSYVAPYGSEELTTFLSERMDAENCSLVHPLYGNDYSSFCLK
ncbi:MAG TPA: ABC transporter substrate-binding protein [Thermoleophilaceae bacterium]|nr:ABC transporter substrate-binding protein [Thermoleophilaceae bacterium]